MTVCDSGLVKVIDGSSTEMVMQHALVIVCCHPGVCHWYSHSSCGRTYDLCRCVLLDKNQMDVR